MPTYVEDRLNYWAEATPDAEAMTYLGRTWTWAQWHERVHRAAGGLRDGTIADENIQADWNGVYEARADRARASEFYRSALSAYPGFEEAASGLARVRGG